MVSNCVLLKASKGLIAEATCYGLKFFLSESWPLVMSSSDCNEWETLIAEALLWEPLPSSREAMLLFTYVFTYVLIFCTQFCVF